MNPLLLFIGGFEVVLAIHPPFSWPILISGVVLIVLGIFLK